MLTISDFSLNLNVILTTLIICITICSISCKIAKVFRAIKEDSSSKNNEIKKLETKINELITKVGKLEENPEPNDKEKERAAFLTFCRDMLKDGKDAGRHDEYWKYLKENYEPTGSEEDKKNGNKEDTPKDNKEKKTSDEK